MDILPFLFSATLEGCLLRAFWPQYLTDFPFYTIILCLTALNLSLWVIYKVEIYPNFLSPLRHLPKPKVYPTVSQYGHLERRMTHNFREDIQSSVTAFLNSKTHEGKIIYNSSKMFPMMASSISRASSTRISCS